MGEAGRYDPPARLMKKRSVTIAGHATSVTLEDAFWDELGVIAARDGMTIAALITLIDEERDQNSGLSSALRVFILKDVKGRNS